jgi:high-affinity K+ transport system ATPase subunit B
LQVKNDTLAARNLKADEDKLILKNQVIELEEKVQRMQLRIAELEALVQHSDYVPFVDELVEGDNAVDEAALVNTGEES